MVRPWPLLLLALPAAAAVWSGWVGIGQMTGFGQVHPLPELWASFHLNTAITLPVGVEAYAAYALRAWLSTSSAVPARTRRFARRSAIASLLLGMAGQVAYHLLAQAKATHAPWGITTAVACLLAESPGTVLGSMHRPAPWAARRRGWRSLPVRQPVTLTFSAWGPFWPWVMSSSTFCPSSRLR
jgi:hypothetical protein